MKKRRLKKSVKLALIGLIGLIILIIVIINIVKTSKYHKTYEYKFLNLGYSESETNYLLELEDKQKEYILTLEHNKIIPELFDEKYFIYKNIDSYLSFYNENANMKVSKIISMVNVNANYDNYDTNVTKETDIDQGILMLVNKYNYLTEEYNPDNLESISTVYSYNGHILLPEAKTAYEKMAKAANKDGYRLIVNYSYKSYEQQKSIWDNKAFKYGNSKADLYAARAGHSEHQTGLAIDLTTNVEFENFEETEAYTWLINNSYKYGFILRYPSDKEDITGYEYESYHFRYVGTEVATKLKNENITFDEYYAYYIAN